MSDMVDRAKELAYRAHKGQVDKAGRPYIEHVARVAEAVRGDDLAETVAWLHDILEDCAGEEAAIMDFSKEVVLAVILLTRWHDEPAEAYYRRLKTNGVAKKVKLADIADNSDPVRLAMLDAKTAKRLQVKYAKALAALLG